MAAVVVDRGGRVVELVVVEEYRTAAVQPRVEIMQCVVRGRSPGSEPVRLDDNTIITTLKRDLAPYGNYPQERSIPPWRDSYLPR